MKTKVLAISMALVALIPVTSCQSKKSDAKKGTTVETVLPESDQIKDEIVKIVNSLPSNTETVNLINSTGAAYLAGFTGEEMKTENLLTRAEKAKAYGTLLFDLAYTNTYNQVESFTKLLKIYETLTKDLGFEELVESQKEYRERLQANKNNPDSVNFLVSSMLQETNDLIQKTGSAVDISLVFGGAVAKSLHVISYITMFAPGKDKLIDILQKQKEVINAACQILEKSPANQDAAKLYQALLPVNNLYNSTSSFSAQTVEDINKMTGFISI